MSRVIDLRIQKSKPVGRRPAKRQLVIKLWLPMRRRVNWAIIAALALTIVAPVTDAALTHARYDLKPDSNLLSSANPRLEAKISYDSKGQQYQFNKDGKKATSPTGQTTVGATGPDVSKLYSADLPVAANKGVTIYDNVNSLSVGFIPQFATSDGKQRDDKIVYPVDSGQLIYTTKANGLKEDIILQRVTTDQRQFKYKLNLPAELEAKLLPNGAVGVYSADPTLFGNISFGSEADQQKVEAARKNGAKTNLVFAIPAPVIHQTGKASGNPTAKFALDGDILTVSATGLKSASYPLSIDPSMVVTSASDFTKGNNEGIDFDLTNNQILRPGLTGSTIGAWDSFSTASLNTARQGHVVATYNGYIYAATGTGASSSALTSVEYATLSNGTIGTWQTTTAVPASRNLASGVIYDGYFYIGGGTISSVNSATVIYAPVNTDGTLGSWNTTSSMTTARQSFKIMAYNSHLYAAAGCVAAACTSGSTATQSVEDVAVKADGTLGNWATTTAFTLSARTGIGAAIYNGYIYVAGGLEGINTEKADGQYAPINADGTVGTWHAIGNLSVARQHVTLVVANGYAYAIGGSVGLNSQTTVEYATINSDGSLGSWTQTSALSLGRHLGGGVVYAGYIYMVSGFVNGNLSAATTSTKIDPAGASGKWSAGPSFTTARYMPGTTAYNGYLYVVGGCTTAGTFLGDVQYAAIGSDGSIGSWTTNSNSLVNARCQFGLVAYNGYMYAVGGSVAITGATAIVEYAAINTNGSVGTWATTNSINVARFSLQAFGYGNYIYMLGGRNGGTNYNDIQYALMSSSGTLGSWTTSSHTFSQRYNFGLAVGGGYVYVLSGLDASIIASVEFAQILSSGDVSAWQTTTATPQGRNTPVASYRNGYIYYGGGCSAVDGSGGCTSFNNDINFAKVNSADGTLTTQTCANGTVTTWCTSGSSFLTAREFEGSVIYGGYMFIAGGCTAASSFLVCTSSLSDTQSAPINNGGPGGTGSWANSSNSLGTARFRHTTAVYNGSVYVVGGCTNLICGTATASVEYSNISAGGSLGAWSSSSIPLPASRNSHQTVVANGFLYVLGGSLTSGTTNDVLFAKLPSNGGDLVAQTCPAGLTNSGNWCTGSTGFTSARTDFGAAVSNGYVYVTGGCTDTACSTTPFLSDTQYAKLNSDGTIGSWSTAGTSFTSGRHAHAAVAYSGYLYIIAGCTGSVPVNGCASATVTASDVQYAKTNTTGGLASDAGCGSVWCTGPRLNIPRGDFGAVGANGYLYVSGGQNSGGAQISSAEFAAIGANGALGVWQSTSNLTAATAYYGMVWYGGLLYLAGGGSNGAVVATAMSAGQQAIPRIGHYSRLLDSDVDLAPTKLIANGTKGGTDTSLSLNYQTALSSGAALGNPQTVSPITLGSVTSTLSTVSGGVARYYWLNFTLDDSLSAVFPDAPTTITDFTLYYHANPAKRLHGGKTFTGNVQQSLDASP